MYTLAPGLEVGSLAALRFQALGQLRCALLNVGAVDVDQRDAQQRQQHEHHHDGMAVPLPDVAPVARQAEGGVLRLPRHLLLRHLCTGQHTGVSQNCLVYAAINYMAAVPQYQRVQGSATAPGPANFRVSCCSFYMKENLLIC